MVIDIEKYILNDIGDTSWYGEAIHDDESLENMEKIDIYLYILENLRTMLISKLTDHINYRKGNYSAERLHYKAKKIMEKHIMKEFTDTDFDSYFEGE